MPPLISQVNVYLCRVGDGQAIEVEAMSNHDAEIFAATRLRCRPSEVIVRYSHTRTRTETK